MMTYRVPREIHDKVLSLLKRYESIKEDADSLGWDFDDYMDGIATQYGRISTSPTNSISRKTESLAIMHVDMQRRQRRAEETIRAINAGILRAARSCSQIGRGRRIKDDLISNMIYGCPRESLTIDCRTLTKYRKRAIYYIAVEMKYIEDKENSVSA